MLKWFKIAVAMSLVLYFCLCLLLIGMWVHANKPAPLPLPVAVSTTVDVLVVDYHCGDTRATSWIVIERYDNHRRYNIPVDCKMLRSYLDKYADLSY